MNQLEPLFTVQSFFTIRGRGVVLVGVAADQMDSVQRDDVLLIQRPDGSTVQTAVRGVEYAPSVKWIGKRPNDPRFGVLVDFAEIPVGSIVHRASA